jgi:hypothetical protein
LASVSRFRGVIGSGIVNIALVVLALFWAVARSGTGVYPALDWYLPIVAKWPERSTAEFEGYLSDSPLGIILANALGAESEQGFLILSFITSVASLIGLAVWVALQVETVEKWRGARLAVLAPVGAVLFTWIGSYDAFTVASWAIVLFAWSYGSRLVFILSGALLGFQHFEHAVFGVVILTIVWFALKDCLPIRFSQRNPAWVLIGLIAGRLVLEAIFRMSGESGNGRSEWIISFIVEWNKTGLNIAPQLLWSLFAGSWIVVFLLILSRWNKRFILYFAAAFSVGMVALLASGDRPRVFILVFFPAFLLMIVALFSSGDISLREKRMAEIIVWMAPPLIFWGKEVANTNVIDLGTMLIQRM